MNTLRAVFKNASFLVLFVLISCTASFKSASVNRELTTPPYEKDKTYHFTLLHTNDTHGRFWRNDDGEYGQSARATLIHSIREEVKAKGGTVLLLDAGDFNTGVPDSDLQDAVPDLVGMNKIGYQAAAVGNHEFDKSPKVLARQIGSAQFPILSANIYNQKENKRLLEPYTLIDVGGLKVAVVGLTTPDTYKLVLPDNVKDLEFHDSVREMQALLPEVDEKSDLVIALSHLGYYPNGEHGTLAPGDVELARATEGIDIIVGGHSHTAVCMLGENKLDENHVPGAPCKPDKQKNTWIFQAGEWGKYLGRADFSFTNGVLTLENYSLIPVNLKKTVTTADNKKEKVYYTSKIEEDPLLLAELSPYKTKGDALLNQKVGTLEGDLDGSREHVRAQQTNLGKLIATAMKQKTQADFAIMNGGGIRDSIKSGEVTYRNILKVMPFGNTTVVVTLTGKEVIELLTYASSVVKGGGGYPHYAGVVVSTDGNKFLDAKVNGAPIEPSKLYRVAMNNFVAAGGDGYPKYNTKSSYIDTGYVDADLLREQFAGKTVKAADFAP